MEGRSGRWKAGGQETAKVGDEGQRRTGEVSEGQWRAEPGSQGQLRAKGAGSEARESVGSWRSQRASERVGVTVEQQASAATAPHRFRSCAPTSHHTWAPTAGREISRKKERNEVS
ncbi:Protein of unknown function [Gryllus bimaculatus]|nr:Protein of unknown function [Gryllus bimaculatus]